MTATLINTLLAYLIGSVSGSLLLGRLKQVDIRRMGSGNAGGTNALRTQGLTFALGVVIIDIGKGVLAAFLPAWFLWGAAPQASAALFCGMAAVIGHCFPVWHGFRGGKGAATAVGAILVIQPLALVPMLSVWVFCLVITGWVGLSTMMAGASLLPALIWLDAPDGQWLFGVAVALFLIFTHRNNIRAMINGTENRFERVRVRNWFRHG